MPSQKENRGKNQGIPIYIPMLWFFFPFLVFIFLSLTYLKILFPDCSLGRGLLGCTPRCTPEVLGRIQKDFPFGGACKYEEPSLFDKILFEGRNEMLFISIIILLGLLVYLYDRKKLKSFLLLLIEIAFKPFFLWRRNRKSRLLPKIINFIVIFLFLIPVWMIGYFVVFGEAIHIISTRNKADLYINQGIPDVLPSTPVSSQNVLEAINEVRKKEKLSVLKESKQLNKAAQEKIASLLEAQNWDKAVKIENLAKKVGYPYSWIGETSYLAISETPSEVVDFWLANAGNTILFDQFTEVGIATASGKFQGSNGVMVSVIYGRRAVDVPQKKPIDTSEEWGVAKQIDEVTWEMKVGQDQRIGTPQDIFEALNIYRQRHGSGTLAWDNNLADFAQSRAAYLNSIKGTDKHAGFNEYVKSEDNLRKLGFWGVGENSGYGNRLSGTHLVEWIYAGDLPHNSNQLDPSWTHVGIGVEGLGVSFIFGKWKM